MPVIQVGPSPGIGATPRGAPAALVNISNRNCTGGAKDDNGRRSVVAQELSKIPSGYRASVVSPQSQKRRPW